VLETEPLSDYFSRASRREACSFSRSTKNRNHSPSPYQEPSLK